MQTRSNGQRDDGAERPASSISSRLGLRLTALVVLLCLTPAMRSSAMSHPAEQYVEGEAIVTFKSSADFTAAQQILKEPLSSKLALGLRAEN